ncbi:hypothetical protein [Candidatus Magnetominusculus dajiuhuensis]
MTRNLVLPAASSGLRITTAYKAYAKSGEFAKQNEAQSYPRLTE